MSFKATVTWKVLFDSGGGPELLEDTLGEQEYEDEVDLAIVVYEISNRGYLVEKLKVETSKRLYSKTLKNLIAKHS